MIWFVTKTPCDNRYYVNWVTEQGSYELTFWTAEAIIYTAQGLGITKIDWNLK